MILRDNKCYHVLHEVKFHKNGHTSYVILHENQVLYWRPELKYIECEFTNINDIKDIIEQIKHKKYRNEEAKANLLKHWSEIYTIIRDYKIDLATSPIVEYNTYMFA